MIASLLSRPLLVLFVVTSLDVFANPFRFDGRSGGYQREICGPDDMVFVTQASEAIYRQLSMPVGHYVTSEGSFTSHCSGVLVDRDLFLTARHCAGPCSGTTVRFGERKDNTAETFACREIVEKGSDSTNQDYLLIRLEGNPGVKWGWHPLSDRALSINEPLLIVHHPAARPMTMSKKDCNVVRDSNGLIWHTCDTLSGSSGAGILKPNYEKPDETRVVAVHALGGCSFPDGQNAGPSIRSLASTSPVLRALVK